MIAAGDIDTAAAAADELDAIATAVGAPFLLATAMRASGAVSLQRGVPGAALDALRTACAEWAKLEAPYEHARSRVLAALAYRALGDVDTAELEADAARQTFEHLGAAPDAAQVDALFPTAPPSPAGGLTGRQLEVLGLVAAGRTNREIAEELVLSEHTVRRHLQNIFAKVGVTSRARLGLDAPAGGTVHLAGPSPRGGWRVVEVFDSAEDASRFLKEQLVPALQVAGVRGRPPEPEFWPVHNYMVSGAPA